MDKDDAGARREKWARLRFAVVGPLLASPPPAGQLGAEFERLSQRDWEHPSGKGPVRFAASTIERWYYRARAEEQDPVKALRRKPRTDVGRERSMSAGLIAALREQYRVHPSWAAQLHYETLKAHVATHPELGPMPSYATLTRAMRNRGLVRERPRKWHEGEDKPAVEAREVLSYEVSRSHALWHGDFHHGKRRVLTASGEWQTPILLGFLDDHSRLGCHLQWYLEETAEVFVHGLCQAFMKRDLPRSLLTDNGGPMTAGEVEEGLHRLGIVGATTLAYSPHQNGKIESFWGTVEGRLMAQLEGVDALTLKMLNDATIAWLEQDYHRRVHRELGMTPHERLAGSVKASRPCPASDELKAAFRIARKRTLRRSDGTVSVEGHPLPGATAVAPPEDALGPLCALGPQRRRSGGRPKRRAAVHAVPPRQARQRRWRPPSCETRQRPWRRQRGRRRTSAAAQGRARRPGRNRPAAGLGTP